MNKLSELRLQYAYHKGENDIAYDFYVPCMERSITYDRAVGFFNSSIYVLCWNSLKDYVERQGKIRFICSPILSGEDINAIEEGYSAKGVQKYIMGFKEELDGLLVDPWLAKPTRVVASLVALGIIDFKIAFIGYEASSKNKKLFHDKLGIFGDGLNYVVFKGSMNETWSGLSHDGNLESVDVFVSWLDERERERVEEEQRYFEKLWNNDYPNTEVIDFPDISRDQLINAAEVHKLSNLIDEVNQDIILTDTLSADKGMNRRKPRLHQVNSLKNWFNNDRRGIFEHATGSGKTFTGLCAIRDSLYRSETPLILVPSELLLHQWNEEIKETFSDLDPYVLLCGAGHTQWRTEQRLGYWSAQSGRNRIIIATMPTASTNEFLRMMRDGQHIFILADEVHRLGSKENRKILGLETGARLGLSATPRRAGDPEGTSALLEYFGDIIPPPFLIRDAIKAGVLTPYMYYVHTVNLDQNEQTQWDEFTNRIKRLCAQNKKKPDTQVQERINKLFIQRSRIAKSATGKIQISVDILKKHYTTGQRWIVYCDSQDQIHHILQAFSQVGIQSTEYHSNMEGDRQQTLKHFETVGGIIVSIQCLDEGVDIPSVTHALILASSRNPREFIQRRGRVLRKAKNKSLAYIHDVMVVPTETQEELDTAILKGELVRGIEFGDYAANPSSVTDLKRIALRFNLDYDQLREVGVEVENDE